MVLAYVSSFAALGFGVRYARPTLRADLAEPHVQVLSTRHHEAQHLREYVPSPFPLPTL